jgi:hypothetical protein
MSRDVAQAFRGEGGLDGVGGLSVCFERSLKMPFREEATMKTDGNAILVQAIYIAVAIGLTVWLARTLFRNGTAFLHDVFADRPQLAEAVNKLLVTGFYMLNLGYALWILRASRGYDGFEAMQFLVNLAAIHFVNVLVFWRIRARRELRQMPSPVLPQVFVPPTPAPTEG